MIRIGIILPTLATGVAVLSLSACSEAELQSGNSLMASLGISDPISRQAELPAPVLAAAVVPAPVEAEPVAEVVAVIEPEPVYVPPPEPVIPAFEPGTWADPACAPAWRQPNPCHIGE